jgi:hydroxymethylpyrimidine pyrophosphatase-like HAD family hydrolase
VASDLDGTLLANGSKTIDVETKHCIEKIVNELDKKFVICTGRNVDDILLVADYFDIKKRENLFAIGVNGSFVYDIVHNKYIYKKLMPAEMVKQILDKFEKFLLDKNLKGQISYEMFVAYDEKSIASGELHTHYVQNIDYFKNSYIEHDPGVLSHF